MTHAVGDRAVRMTLDAYELAAAANPAPARRRRHRIEHVETIDPADIPRFAPMGIVASMQPLHSAQAGDPWTGSLGAERAGRGWMYDAILRARGPLVFGSNWPAEPLDPIAALAAAVTRPRPGDPMPPAGAPERVSLEQAVSAYTRGAAWASYDEQRKGILDREMLADLVILSKDIFALPPSRLREAEVMVTIADGKVVYRRDPPETTH
jgi:predicted amidohydrolase YtcJ